MPVVVLAKQSATLKLDSDINSSPRKRSPIPMADAAALLLDDRSMQGFIRESYITLASALSRDYHQRLRVTLDDHVALAAAYSLGISAANDGDGVEPLLEAFRSDEVWLRTMVAYGLATPEDPAVSRLAETLPTRTPPSRYLCSTCWATSEHPLQSHYPSS